MSYLEDFKYSHEKRQTLLINNLISEIKVTKREIKQIKLKPKVIEFSFVLIVVFGFLNGVDGNFACLKLKSWLIFKQSWQYQKLAKS